MLEKPDSNALFSFERDGENVIVTRYQGATLGVPK